MDTTMQDRAARKTAALMAAVPRASRILVVGCGDGREAGLLARHFDAEAVGIGIDDGRFDHDAAAPAELVEMDARDLAFEDGSFDLVYSFHALEHIPGPEGVLAEMARVLEPGGHYLIGTPNKARLVGYVGAPDPPLTKVKYNLNDYRMRLTGRWANEHGAHAGFTRHELTGMCRRAFGDATDVTDDYYDRLYPSKRSLLDAIRRVGLAGRAYPAVYVSGRRTS